jgi:protein phosphatase
MGARTGAATDRGRMREGNEDNFVSREHLFAVADGLGGHQAGEVASQIAVDTLALLEENGPSQWTDEREAVDALRGAIKAANRKIREAASHDRSLEGMGTTITAVLENGHTLYLAHVGDSRAYLYRNGVLTRLTDDHSLVQQLVNEGRLTPEEAEVHPQRSIITRALGMDMDVEPDTATYRRRTGDRLMLCTDGLSGVVSEPEIKRVLQRFADPQEAAEELIAQANNEGGPDNITVVVIDTEDGGPGVISDTTEISEEGVGPTGEGPVQPLQASAGGRTGRGRARSKRPVSPWRRIVAAVVGLGLVAAVVFAAQAFISSRYWVGFDGDEVVIYQGLKGDVAGIQLSRVVQRMNIRKPQVRPTLVAALENGQPKDSLADAQRYAGCMAAPANVPLEQCLATGPTATTVPVTSTTPTSTSQATSTTGG